MITLPWQWPKRALDAEATIKRNQQKYDVEKMEFLTIIARCLEERNEAREARQDAENRMLAAQAQVRRMSER